MNLYGHSYLILQINNLVLSVNKVHKKLKCETCEELDYVTSLRNNLIWRDVY